MSDQLHKPEKIARRIRIAEQVMQDAQKFCIEAGRPDLAFKAFSLLAELERLRAEVESAGNDTQTFARGKAA